MTAPDCTDHGTLILEYIRGNLDDAEGLRAETVSAECPDCRAWLDIEFSGPAFAEVEDVVGRSLQTAPLTKPHHRFSWLTAAAAILAIAGGLAVMQLPNQPTPMVVHQQDETQSTLIGAFDFEAGSIVNTAVVLEESSASAEVREAVEADPLFSDNLEDGGTGSWTVHT